MKPARVQSGRSLRCVLWQGGGALILILVMLVVGALAWWAASLNQSASELKAARLHKTEKALALAKEAIIDRSVSDMLSSGTPNPGRLICPEDTSLIGTPTEGQARNNCPNAGLNIGRLPWRSLKLGELKDGDGSLLWYSYSPGFQQSPINWNTPAGLKLNGADVVAIVFSPGAPLAGQNRSQPTPANPPTLADYLEGENADGDFVFESQSALMDGSSLNDRAVGITKEALFQALARRVLKTACGDASNGLLRYHQINGQFPWAADVPDGSQGTGGNGYLPTADLSYPDVGSQWILPPPGTNRNDWTRFIKYARSTSNSVTLSMENINGIVFECKP